MPQTLEERMRYYLGDDTSALPQSPMQRMGLTPQSRLTEEEEEEKRAIRSRAIAQAMHPEIQVPGTETVKQHGKVKDSYLGRFLEAAPEFSVGVRPEAFAFPPPESQKNPELAKILGAATGAAQMFGPGGKGGLTRNALKTLFGGGLGAFGTEDMDDVRGALTGAGISRAGGQLIRGAQAMKPELATKFGGLFPRAATAASEGTAALGDLFASGREINPLGVGAAAGLGAVGPRGGPNAQANREASAQAKAGIRQTEEYARILDTNKQQLGEIQDITGDTLRQAKNLRDTKRAYRREEKQMAEVGEALKGQRGKLAEAEAKYALVLPKTAQDLERAVGEQITGLTEQLKNFSFPRDRKILDEANKRLDQLNEIQRQLAAKKILMGPNVRPDVLDESSKDLITQYRKFFTPRDPKTGQLLPTKINRDDIRNMTKGLRELEKEYGAHDAARINLESTIDSIGQAVADNKVIIHDKKRLIENYGEKANALLKKNEELYGQLLDQIPENSTLAKVMSSVTPAALTALDAAIVVNTNPFGWAAKRDVGLTTRVLGYFMRSAIKDIKRAGSQEYEAHIPRHFEDLVAAFDKAATTRDHEPAARAGAALWRSYLRSAEGKKLGIGTDEDASGRSIPLEEHMQYYMPAP